MVFSDPKIHVGCPGKQSRACREKGGTAKEFCGAESDCFMCPFVDKSGEPESEVYGGETRDCIS